MTDADFLKMSAFSCGVKALDDFFRYEVNECVEHRYLAAYCVLSEDEKIIAAFTLMNDALMIDTNRNEEARVNFFDDLRLETDIDMVEFFKNQTSYPAINIGHLGTISEYQSNGLGMAIIDLVSETFTNYRQAGCQFITVDALNNPRTLKFYCINGFSFQTNKDIASSTRRMYRILV